MKQAGAGKGEEHSKYPSKSEEASSCLRTPAAERYAFLKVEGLTKRYGAAAAVNGISFRVYQGEVFGLLGPNGAGKTTTIRMLCGLLKADAGSITCNGTPMSTGYNRIKHLIGLCPQEIVVWEQLTGLEQLKFAGMCYGLTRGEAAAKAHRLLEGLGLSPHKHKLARALSGGMQRRLNLALGLVHDPELIILDEPQAGLDPQSKILVRDFIRQLGKRKTVILTTHDMDEADRLSDRIAIMDHGRILAAGTPQALKEQSGTGDLIQIRTTGISRDGAERLFRALPAVFTERSFTDGLLLLGARDVMEHIPLLTQTLKTLRIPIDDMTIRKRTLEDAFIAMTGRGLRE